MKTLVRSLRDISPGLEILQQNLDYYFKDQSLLLQAMTHPSFSIEQSKQLQDNQRLEFLGDTVWQMVLTELLFHRFPNWDEGELTKVRSFLSRTQCMVTFAKTLGISACLLVGKGEANSGGTLRESNLEDAFEALFGAIFLDCHDFKILKQICNRLVDNKLSLEKKLLESENPKGNLQEFTQSNFHCLPQYIVTQVMGPAHAPEFTIEVQINEQVIATATARSRKLAEHQVAQEALKILQQKELHLDLPDASTKTITEP